MASKTKTIRVRLVLLSVSAEYSRYKLEAVPDDVFIDLPTDEVTFDEEGHAVLSLAAGVKVLELMGNAIDSMHEARINQRVTRKL